MVTMAKLCQRNAGVAGVKAVADLWVEGFRNVTAAAKRKERREGLALRWSKSSLCCRVQHSKGQAKPVPLTTRCQTWTWVDRRWQALGSGSLGHLKLCCVLGLEARLQLTGSWPRRLKALQPAKSVLQDLFALPLCAKLKHAAARRLWKNQKKNRCGSSSEIWCLTSPHSSWKLARTRQLAAPFYALMPSGVLRPFWQTGVGSSGTNTLCALQHSWPQWTRPRCGRLYLIILVVSGLVMWQLTMLAPWPRAMHILRIWRCWNTWIHSCQQIIFFCHCCARSTGMAMSWSSWPICLVIWEVAFVFLEYWTHGTPCERSARGRALPWREIWLSCLQSQPVFRMSGSKRGRRPGISCSRQLCSRRPPRTQATTWVLAIRALRLAMPRSWTSSMGHGQDWFCSGFVVCLRFCKQFPLAVTLKSCFCCALNV